MAVSFYYSLLLAECLALRRYESPLVRRLQAALNGQIYTPNSPAHRNRNQIFSDFALTLSTVPAPGHAQDPSDLRSRASGGGAAQGSYHYAQSPGLGSRRALETALTEKRKKPKRALIFDRHPLRKMREF